MHTDSSIRVDCHDEDQIDEHEHEHEHGHEHGHKHEHGHDAARTRVGGVSRTGCARPSGAREKVRCTATSAIADIVVRITRWPNMSTAAPRKGDATAEITYCTRKAASGSDQSPSSRWGPWWFGPLKGFCQGDRNKCQKGGVVLVPESTSRS